MIELSKRDYYELLEVSRDASTEELKKAYRRMARQYHPDFNKEDPDAERKFKEISEAYEVLCDQQKREAYDRFGHQAFEGAGAGGGFGSEFNGFGDISDIFESFFGGFGRQRKPGPEQGRHLRYDMEITLEEAYQGGTREIRIPRTETCPDCKGSKAKSGSSPETCSACGGSGQQQHVRNTAFGRFVNVVTCVACSGEGRIIKNPCPTCRAQGRVVRERTIEVKIPAGVEHGSQLRISGSGEAGLRGGPAGDLYVVIAVRAHKLFRRDGNDLIYELSLSMASSALGTEIEVPTLDGAATLRVPEGTQPGALFRLKGKGMPRLRGGGKGDMRVKVKVVVPKKLNQRQRELLEELESIGDDKGFFDKVKDALGGTR